MKVSSSSDIFVKIRTCPSFSLKLAKTRQREGFDGKTLNDVVDGRNPRRRVELETSNLKLRENVEQLVDLRASLGPTPPICISVLESLSERDRELFEGDWWDRLIYRLPKKARFSSHLRERTVYAVPLLESSSAAQDLLPPGRRPRGACMHSRRVS